MQDEHYMSLAIEEARRAAAENEVPVGAVLVLDDRILARNHNRIIQQNNSVAHAELLVLQEAIKTHQMKWLLRSTLYVTLEPCTMCAGALVLARVQRLVIGALDPKAGACGSVMNIVQSPQLNHRLQVETGLLQNESSVLLKQFFQNRRAQANNP